MNAFRKILGKDLPTKLMFDDFGTRNTYTQKDPETIREQHKTADFVHTCHFLRLIYSLGVLIHLF